MFSYFVYSQNREIIICRFCTSRLSTTQSKNTQGHQKLHRQGGGVGTCRFCLKPSGGDAGPAELHGVEGQHSEGVVDVGRQLEVRCRPVAGDLGEIMPVTSVVQRVLILDQKFCVKQKKKMIIVVQDWLRNRLHDGIFA